MMQTETLALGDTVVRVAGAGAPLVFIHGFTTTAEFWREQMAHFSASHRVVLINLPGHGAAPRPAQRAYTIAAFVADVNAVFDALALDGATLVGLSMGGTVAQQFVLDHPGRVRALVLVGATPHGLGPDVDADNVLAAIESLGVVAASQRVIERSFGSAASAALLAFAREEVAQTPAFVARQAIASLNAADSRARLGEITVPTLAIVGEEDIITPVCESEALADGIPGCGLALIPQAGHFPMLEQPAAFNRVLAAFLAQRAR